MPSLEEVGGPAKVIDPVGPGDNVEGFSEPRDLQLPGFPSSNSQNDSG